MTLIGQLQPWEFAVFDSFSFSHRSALFNSHRDATNRIPSTNERLFSDTVLHLLPFVLEDPRLRWREFCPSRPRTTELVSGIFINIRTQIKEHRSNYCTRNEAKCIFLLRFSKSVLSNVYPILSLPHTESLLALQTPYIRETSGQSLPRRTNVTLIISTNVHFPAIVIRKAYICGSRFARQPSIRTIKTKWVGTLSPWSSLGQDCWVRVNLSRKGGVRSIKKRMYKRFIAQTSTGCS